MSTLDADVVIVGFGPVGQAAAAMLARRGHRVVAYGQSFTFQVLAAGETHDITLTRERCLPDVDAPRVGINLIDPFPIDVRIASGDVGGPSAGLMWAVGLYDLLTPGDITAGKTVAGTGTIDTRGRVGPIGGIQDKVVAAERAGATVFLVPADNMKELAGVDTPGDPTPDRRILSIPAALPTACVRLGCSRQMRCVGRERAPT